MPKSNKLLGTNIPFVQAAHTGSKQRVTAVVLRTSFTTGDPGAALGIARAWHNPMNRVDSCHYVVDRLKIFRCVPDRLSCRSERPKGYNKNSVMINVCHDPPAGPEDLVLYRAARLTARLCRLHRIKVRILNKGQEASWLNHPWRIRGGIILATAGEFSTDKFFEIVNNEYKKFD